MIEDSMTQPQMLVTAPEEPVLCAVCGCRWIEFASPEDECVEATCPCHNRYWDATDELVKRYLWGDK